MQITTFIMIYLTVANEYDPWPGATTFRTFQLPELTADTLTAVLRSVRLVENCLSAPEKVYKQSRRLKNSLVRTAFYKCCSSAEAMKRRQIVITEMHVNG